MADILKHQEFLLKRKKLTEKFATQKVLDKKKTQEIANHYVSICEQLIPEHPDELKLIQDFKSLSSLTIKSPTKKLTELQNLNIIKTDQEQDTHTYTINSTAFLSAATQALIKGIPIDDTLISQFFIEEPIIKPLTLRDYQELSITHMKTKKQGIICLPCGAGKSDIAKSFINSSMQETPNELRIILVCPANLIEQWLNMFTCTVNEQRHYTTIDNFDIIVPKHNIPLYFTSKLLCIVSYQYIFTPEHELNLASFCFDIAIFDEVHYLNGDKINRIIQILPSKCRKYGLTATLSTYEQDKRDKIQRLVGDVIYEIPFNIIKHIFPKVNITYTISEEYHVFNAYFHMLRILNSKQDPVIIIYSELKKILNLFEKYIEKADIPKSLYARIEGFVPQMKREEIFQQINNRTVRILLCTNVIQTGINIPDFSHLIQLHGSKSFNGIIQRFGRLMRNRPDNITKNIICIFKTQKQADITINIVNNYYQNNIPITKTEEMIPPYEEFNVHIDEEESSDEEDQDDQPKKKRKHSVVLNK
jgi:superfamily II DNA or RNA helicase